MSYGASVDDLKLLPLLPPRPLRHCLWPRRARGVRPPRRRWPLPPRRHRPPPRQEEVKQERCPATFAVTILAAMCFAASFSDNFNSPSPTTSVKILNINWFQKEANGNDEHDAEHFRRPFISVHVEHKTGKHSKRQGLQLGNALSYHAKDWQDVCRQDSHDRLSAS
ncbi:signal peptidase complex subunit 3B-like isoform X1 [Phragmites australis]|uniref:signal peptidase complex subunit 3B-like isoform X1 n=1 Tax=Phragmites australis TaxID=29695 RepID=UPI002D788ED2|nr:signal peptidase complex subunit 3B-like isoform X1 [Phragmites australis]